MATLTIKDIPDELYHQLKQNAQAHRRSLNNEVLVCLERNLGNPRGDAETMLVKIRSLRKKNTHLRLNDVTLAKAKREGRL